MSDDILIGTLIEDSWLTIEQVAAACAVEPQWLIVRLDAGLFTHAECAAGVWRLSTVALRRARSMRELERDFDAVPELAALVADLQEELDTLRARLARYET